MNNKKEVPISLNLGRKDFLKTTGFGGVSFILPFSTPKPGIINQMISQPVKIYDNYLRGAEYYDLGRYLDEIKVGDEVSFK